MSELDKIQRDIRDACPSGLWSRGVKMSREGKVEIESTTASEIVVRCAASRGIAPTAILYPTDRDWECDCGSQFDACEHVAAAIIVLVSAKTSGAEPARADPSGAGRLLYLFARKRGSLALSRELIGLDGTTAALTRSVAAYVAGLVAGQVELRADRSDLEADGVLGPHPAELLPAKTSEKLCAALAGTDRARLDGAPIQIAAESIGPMVRVSKSGDGVSLLVSRAGVVDEVLGPGYALCDGTIRPLSATNLTGQRLESLPLTKRFSSHELGELVGKVLPALRREVELRVDSDVELPGLARNERPRIDLGLRVSEGSVEVLPLLVYGAGPSARIDGDTLVHLRGEVPVRDKPLEKELILALRDELNLVCNRSIGFIGNEATDFLRRYRRSRFAENAEQVARAIALEAQVVVSATGVTVRFVAGDGSEASATDVIAAWDADNQIVPLSGGLFGRLPDGWLEGHVELVRDLLAAEGSPLRAMAPARALADEAGLELPPRLANLEPLARQFSELKVAKLPADFTGALRGYQQVGVNWLSFLRGARLGGVLADDMGLGKTVQVLAAVPAKGRTLVVAPTSTLSNWQNETARFRPQLSVCLFHGSARELTEAEIVITSYALLRRDIDALGAIEWDLVVLDEAQAIKNSSSQAARASRKLKARSRIALSGTPIENRLAELWSISEFANPRLLGSESEFADRFAKPIADGDAPALSRLRTLLRPVVLRRRKREVAPELPPRTEVLVSCELTESEREIYEGLRAAAKSSVVKQLAAGGNPMSALTALLRLRQAACHPGLLPQRSAPTSSKLDRLSELLARAADGGHKALVFSQWTSLLDLVEPALKDLGLEFLRLDGSTRDRGAVVDGFQSSDGPPVLLISLKAGGTGLNLTAADHVFLLDPWWNPAVEEQAADRAHRIGQDKPVLVHRMIAADTVEERIFELKRRKLALAHSALDGVGAGAAMTRDDLLALLD